MGRLASALPSNAIGFTEKHVDLYAKIVKGLADLIDESLDHAAQARAEASLSLLGLQSDLLYGHRHAVPQAPAPS